MAKTPPPDIKKLLAEQKLEAAADKKLKASLEAMKKDLKKFDADVTATFKEVGDDE